METLEDFVVRLSNDVGCYYHKTKKSRYYTIKKYNSNYRGQMGHFGWVDELIRDGIFRIESYKDKADKVNVTKFADAVKKNRIYQKGVDGVLFYVKKESHGDDYQKAMTSLKAIVDLVS